MVKLKYLFQYAGPFIHIILVKLKYWFKYACPSVHVVQYNATKTVATLKYRVPMNMYLQFPGPVLACDVYFRFGPAGGI